MLLPVFCTEREENMLRPATNVQSIDRTALKQRSSVKITKDAPRQERMAELMRQIDPYCYLDGDVVVISRFADTDVSITDCCKAYLAGL